MKKVQTLILLIFAFKGYCQISDSDAIKDPLKDFPNLLYSGSFEVKAKDTITSIDSRNRKLPSGWEINIQIDQLKDYLNTSKGQEGMDKLVISLGIDTSSETIVQPPKIFVHSVATMDEINNQIIGWADTTKIKLIKKGNSDFKKGKRHDYRRNVVKYFDNIKYSIDYECTFFAGVDGSMISSYSITKITVNNRSIEDFVKNATAPNLGTRQKIYKFALDDITTLIDAFKRQMPGKIYKYQRISEYNNAEDFR